MKRKQVWRYYCEFCKKAGCSGGHVASHERACTANPNRVCRMHAHVEKEQLPIADLIAILAVNVASPDVAVTKLREATDSCPACMLAAIRQSDLQHAVFDEEGINVGVSFTFDFKAEVAEFWSNINNANAEQ